MQLATAGSDTVVYVDADGAGQGAAVQVATLLNVSSLLLNDLAANQNLLYA